MKRSLYYVLPFIITPLLLFFCEMLDRSGILRMSTAIMCIVLIFGALLMGSITPTERKVDSFMAVLVPLSLFVVMFLVAFLENGESYARFDFAHGWRVASQCILLMLYPVLAVCTLLASYKPLRLKNC